MNRQDAKHARIQKKLLPNGEIRDTRLPLDFVLIRLCVLGALAVQFSELATHNNPKT